MKIFLGINDTSNNCSSSLQSHFSERLYYSIAKAVNMPQPLGPPKILPDAQAGLAQGGCMC